MRVNDMTVKELKAELERGGLWSLIRNNYIRQYVMRFVLKTTIRDEKEATWVQQPLKILAVFDENPTASFGNFDLTQLMPGMYSLGQKESIFGSSPKQVQQNSFFSKLDSDDGTKKPVFIPIKENLPNNNNAIQNDIRTTQNNIEPGEENSLNQIDVNFNSKPWYFSNGVRLPKETRINRKTNKQLARLFPWEDPHTDRITNQLMYIPPNYEQLEADHIYKTILLYNGLGPWNVKAGRELFTSQKCPVSTCTITANRETATTADLVVFKDHYVPPGVWRRPRQIYMIYLLECPFHTQHMKYPDVFNWTATYRMDSDVVAPYEKWEYYDPKVKQMEQEKNYALNKTKKVAWFVSNCGARNGRLQYAHELQKYIQVDIYGGCGNYKCTRSSSDRCFELLDHDYKFYLAFENSNCKDYITEKLFINALNRNILPIVMGARPEDYERSAPYKSYIHVDEFSSPKELAEYLNILDKNDELYNSYFKWKGTGELINTYFWCRLCAMLHDEDAMQLSKYYEDVNEWWRGTGVCTNGSWRNFQARRDTIKDD